MRPIDFYYNVSGEEAERLLLRYGKDGEFLARPSESAPNHYTLSIKRGEIATHIKCQKHGNSVDLYGGECFPSLADLIRYYMENPDQLKQKNGESIVLKQPVKLPAEERFLARKLPTADRWFHSNITGKDAVKLLTNERQWAFLVRESQRTPGQYVISVKTSEDSYKHIKIERNPLTGRFHVGGGDEFERIHQLLVHYKKNPMVEEGTQNVVRLATVVPSTKVPVQLLLERLRALEREHEFSHKDGFADEFERLNNADDQLYSRKEGKMPYNVEKNRYKNIVPYDHTRVSLKESPSGRDYINANYIRLDGEGELMSRTYISTQGCLPNTVGDFWRMCYHEKVTVIVMTTKENERGRVKCDRYWPSEGDTTKVDEDCFTLHNLKEKVYKHEDKDSFIERHIQLVHNKDGKSRDVVQLQFIAWPDHGCPEDPVAVLTLLKKANEECAKSPASPLLVHCSAGIGRTGTFIVLDLLMRHIMEHGADCTVDVSNAVLAVREQRQGLVQTEPQYKFIYYALSSFVNSHILKLDTPDMQSSSSQEENSENSSLLSARSQENGDHKEASPSSDFSFSRPSSSRKGDEAGSFSHGGESSCPDSPF